MLEQIQAQLNELEEASSLRKATPTEPLPNRKEVIDLIKDLQSLLFPGYFKSRSVTAEGLSGVRTAVLPPKVKNSGRLETTFNAVRGHLLTLTNST